MFCRLNKVRSLNYENIVSGALGCQTAPRGLILIPRRAAPFSLVHRFIHQHLYMMWLQEIIDQVPKNIFDKDALVARA